MPMRGNGPTTSPIQDEFIEWMVDPDKTGSQADWARAHDVHPNTLTKWKQDIRFRKAWEVRCAELNVDPGRVQDVINAVFREAVAGDTKAASLYLQYIDKFTPKTVSVVEDRTVKDMSDDELAEELEAEIIALRG